MPKSLRKDRDFSSRIIKISRPPSLFHSGHFPSPSPLQEPSEANEHYNELGTIVRGPINTRYSNPRGNSVVERPSPRAERQRIIPTPSRPNNRDRCLSKGGGGGGGWHTAKGSATGGSWCSEEKRIHISCLELLAGSFAVKTLTKTKVCAHVRLTCAHVDSVAAVAYINKMGGTHSHTLANLAIALWEWYLKNLLMVSAQHLPGKLNIRADRESRVLTNSSNWKLILNLFQAILKTWGPLEVDLFALRLTFQLSRFVSWKPDPLAIQTDAFTMNWKTIRGYAFPPFALIGRCLRQVMPRKVEQLILITPVWPAQPWYPLLLQLCIYLPILLPLSADLLTKDNEPHPLNNLQLAGWKLFAYVSKQRMFQQKLERFCRQHGEETHQCLLFILE